MDAGLSPGKAITQPINHSHQTQHLAYPMPTPNSFRLATLTQLRERARPPITLAEMARACGLSGNTSRLTVGAWEHGTAIPRANRRPHLLRYLWDTLQLRRDPAEFERVWQILVEEWAWEPISDREWQSLTNTPRPTPIVVTNERVAATTAPPFQAPSLIPHFVGRQSQLTALTPLLQSATLAVIALVGMGGSGKTTLATYAAHELQDTFPGGVLWARVAMTNPLDIMQSWAQAFGHDYSSLTGVESRAAALRALLAQKQVLLVLDDVTDAAQVRPLLPGIGRSVTLLTTRDANVAGALNAQVVSVAELTPMESLALFQAVVPAERVAAERDAAAQICATLHHLPLAVEIAAQRLKVRSTQKLSAAAAHLQDITARLDLSMSDDRAVRASFLASWEGLSARLRHLFACCGLFGGRAFSTAALAYIADLTPGATEEALFTLMTLSLLTSEGEDRFHQHPLLADFAREQLAEDAKALERFIAYYLRFAQQYREAYHMLELEWGNLMAAMQIAYKHDQRQAVLTYADLLYPAWYSQARFEEALTGLTWACTIAKACGDQVALTRNLQHWGNILVEQNQYTTAQQLLQESLAAAIALEHDELVANAYWTLARIAIEQADNKAAEPFLQRCKETRTYLADTVGVASVSYWLAMIAFRQQRLSEAEALCQEALAVQQQYIDRVGALRTLRLFMDIMLNRGDFPSAQGYAEEMQQIIPITNDKGECAAALLSLGKFYRRRGDLPTAISHIEEGLLVFRQIGSLNFSAFSHYELSKIQAAMTNYETALAACQQCVTLLKQINDRYNVVSALLFQGDLQLQLALPTHAHACWQEALVLAQPQQHPDLAALQERLMKLIDR